MSQSVASALAEAENHTGEKHVLKILCPHLGDDETEFDPKDKKEIERAAKKFKSAIKERGMVPFAVDGPGTAERIREFDPERKTTILSAPIRGG